jgi:hypothetical protein
MIRDWYYDRPCGCAHDPIVMGHIHPAESGRWVENGQY